jgi:hypothetical protein
MFGMVRLVLGKYVGLHPGTGYILMNYMTLVGMTGLGWELGSFQLEQIDFPSVVAAISLAAVAGLSMDAVRGVSRSFGDLGDLCRGHTTFSRLEGSLSTSRVTGQLVLASALCVYQALGRFNCLSFLQFTLRMELSPGNFAHARSARTWFLSFPDRERELQ